MKVTNKVVDRIKEMKEKGHTAYSIAKILHIPHSTVFYWMHPNEERTRIREYVRKSYKIKYKEDPKFRKKKLAYAEEYYKNRYKTDEEFRKSVIKSTINYHNKVAKSKKAIIRYLKRKKKATKKQLKKIVKKYKIKDKTLDTILSKSMFKVGKRWIRYVG